MFAPRWTHADRLRIAALALLSLCFLFTLTFVISASVTVHGHYAMTKLEIESNGKVLATTGLSLTNAIVCVLGQDCEIYSIGDLRGSDVWNMWTLPDTCPQSAGSWVIAAQSLILFFLLVPLYSVTKSVLLPIPRQRIVAGVTLSLSFIFAALSIAVWYSQCVAGMTQEEESSRQPEVDAAPSGAYAFMAFNFVLLVGASICSVAYWVLTRHEDSSSSPLTNAFAQNPAGDSSAQYYHANY